jgi:hypothetical protein
MWGGVVSRVVWTLRMKETPEYDTNSYLVFKLKIHGLAGKK